MYDIVKGLYEGASSVLLYLAIAVIGCVVAVGLLVYFFKRDRFSVFVKYAVGIVAGLAICALVIMTYLRFECIKADEDIDMSDMLFYPILAELIIAVAGAVAMLVCSLFNKKATKIAGIVAAVGLVGGFIAIMVEMAKYYPTVKDWYQYTNTTGLIVSGIIFMLVIAVIYFLGDKRKISDTRSIVYGAVAVALSFALSYVKFFALPQGGSVTFASLLPLMIYCCMFGTRRGTLVCLVYGLLQAIQDPWILHPMQFLLDYPLAFGLIGVSGIFVEKKVFKDKKIIGFIVGGIVAVVGRYVCHVLSGVFAFAEFANVNSALVYSLTYNSFAFADMAIALAAGSMLFLSKAFTAQMDKSGDIGGKAQVEAIEAADDDDDFVYPDDKISVSEKTEAESSERTDSEELQTDILEDNAEQYEEPETKEN